MMHFVTHWSKLNNSYVTEIYSRENKRRPFHFIFQIYSTRSVVCPKELRQQVDPSSLLWDKFLLSICSREEDDTKSLLFRVISQCCLCDLYIWATGTAGLVSVSWTLFLVISHFNICTSVRILSWIPQVEGKGQRPLHFISVSFYLSCERQTDSRKALGGGAVPSPGGP